MLTSERFLSDCLPKTKEEIRAMIVDWNKRTENFGKCESPIEHDFLHCFYKVNAEDVSIESQVYCQTRAGSFRLDFVIAKGRRRIGVECDGKNFHDKKRDRLRDDAVLETGFVDTIYRVPGRSLWFFTYEVLDLLQGAEPSLFSERGKQILEAHLDDGSKREDSWDHDSALRALSERKIYEDEDLEEGGEECKSPQYKSPQYVLLEWRRREGGSSLTTTGSSS